MYVECDSLPFIIANCATGCIKLIGFCQIMIQKIIKSNWDEGDDIILTLSYFFLIFETGSY